MPGNIDEHIHIETLANVVYLIDVEQESIDRDFGACAAGIWSFGNRLNLRQIDSLRAQGSTEQSRGQENC